MRLEVSWSVVTLSLPLALQNRVYLSQGLKLQLHSVKPLTPSLSFSVCLLLLLLLFVVYEHETSVGIKREVPAQNKPASLFLAICFHLGSLTYSSLLMPNTPGNSEGSK